MASNTKTNTYQLHLKGFVGGYDFDADYVDYVLSKHKDTEVNVLIDSLGGQSSTALSIFSAFKLHDNVNVHFVGMNASAATIASLGAKHITMDSSAMYLVHKCSIGFFEWGQLNSDGLQALIANIEHQKADLDKLDANIAQMYATRCKKEPEALLALMKEGGWLTAKEALEWGFVDELTDYADESAPVLTDTMACAMSAAGIPIPNMPTMHLTAQEQSAFTKFLGALGQLFSNQKIQSTNNSTQTPMKKIFKSICAILTCEHLMSNEGKITLSDAQMEDIESAISADKQSISDLNAQITTLKREKQFLTDANTQLQAEVATLKQKPGDTTAHIVNDKHTDQPAEKSEAEQYFESRANAQSLFDSLP
jgi:ATP-dependent protease ClpP protease subunit/regulator of replication initiation timing